MKEKLLPSVELSNSYVEQVDKYLVKFFREEIYLPLMAIIKDYSKVQNSEMDLMLAIQKGRVSFYRGRFTGKFSATISRQLKKMGAKWEARNGGYFALHYSQLSPDIRLAIKTAESSWLVSIGKINEKLNQVLGEGIAEKIDVSSMIDKALFSLDNDMKSGAKGFLVFPELTDKNRRDIAENYTNNMRYYIQDFTEKEIVKLRKKVREVTFSGGRYESLAKTIKQSYGVSENKANFLARQETNLLVAKFKESRYTEAGADEYEWQTVVGSPNHPVRDFHARLKGKRFKFSSPPVVNERGDRKNPREDYGCRCTARIVVRF